MSAAPSPAATAKPPLPAPRQDVVITLPDLEQYGGRVSAVTGTEIAIVLLFAGRGVRGVPLGDAAPMWVEYPAPRGLVRLEGSGTVVAHDLVHFHHEGAVDVVQRREFVRVSAVRALELARVGADGRPGAWMSTLTVNVSGNGLLAAGWAGTESLEVGALVDFRLRPAEGEPLIAGRGRVVRVGDDGQRGIAIEQIERDARRQLVRFVFEQERIARRRTRDGEL